MLELCRPSVSPADFWRTYYVLSAQNDLTDFFRTNSILHTETHGDSDPGGSVGVLEGNFGQLLDF